MERENSFVYITEGKLLKKQAMNIENNKVLVDSFCEQYNVGLMSSLKIVQKQFCGRRLETSHKPFLLLSFSAFILLECNLDAIESYFIATAYISFSVSL